MSSRNLVEQPDASSSPSALEARIGHHFSDPDLFRLAVTHRSWCAEHLGDESNERLEFLGDAVLGLVVTDVLFAQYPDRPEGQLAQTRAVVVSAATLAEVGGEMGVGPHLLLGKGELASGGRAKPSILADAVEAIIGAVYLDGGMEAARRLVLAELGPRIERASRVPGLLDHKTRLQELAARTGNMPPRYVVDESGPDHDKRFRAVVSIGEIAAVGEGSTKKEAEQRAAGAAVGELAEGGRT
jgi:ribonuclease-3